MVTTATGAATWQIGDSITGAVLMTFVVPAVIFGLGDPDFANNDLPLRGDYDGDGRADIAVFRPCTTVWYWINSSNGTVGVQQWGALNDTPVPNFFTF